MTPIFISKVGTNPSILSFNATGSDGKIIKAKDEKGKLKAVVFAVMSASMWGKSYLLRKNGWSDGMATEHDVVTTFFKEASHLYLVDIPEQKSIYEQGYQKD